MAGSIASSVPDADPLRFRRLRRRVLLLGVLVIVAFGGSSSFDAWVAHGDTQIATQRAIENLAAALAEQTAWTIQGVDVVLSDTVRWYDNNRDKIPPERVAELLEDRTAGVRQIRLITITDARGLQRYRSQGMSPADLNVSDRAYFTAQRDRTVRGLYMSEPLASRSVGKMAIILSRRLENDSGEFAGVVSAILDLDELARYYSAISLGKGDSVQLQGKTGMLYVHIPPAPQWTDKPLALRLTSSRSSAASFVDPISGEAVYGAAARVRDTPLVLQVMRSTSVAMQSWRSETLRLAIRTVAVSLLGALAIAAFWRQLRQTERSEHALRERQQRRAESQKLEAIGTLAGGIAHDFNNILGAIVGYGELARQESAPLTPLRRYMDNIMQAADRAKALVDLILGFSRSGVGEKTHVNIQTVVEEVITLIAASLPSNIRLEQRLSAGTAALLGDSTHLHQVILNLCTNALNAMERGGMLSIILDRVTLHTQRTMLRGRLIPGHYARLTIADTGVGISSAVLERMFDPFFTTRKVGHGTGLGLSLVHGIVIDMGGAIDLQTDPVKGTSFEIWLPVIAQAALAAVPVSLDQPHGQGQTVMIIDDERMLVALAEELLAGLDYEPVGFESSAAALAAFRDQPERFDIVLTDEAMPDMSGLAVARRLRTLRPDIPIILMSGHATASLTAEAAGIDISIVLHKPLSRTDIARSMSQALRGRVA